MITIIGVGHVFDIKDQVREIVLAEMPGAVCVELDQDRYSALLHPEQRRTAPPTYRILSKFQRRLAEQFGGELGSEMLAAVNAAQEISVPALFVDANARSLFDQLTKAMPFRERVLLFVSAISGLFTSRKRVENELEQFSGNEEQYLKEFEKQFPTLKKVLIDDRNQIMASNLAQAEAQHGSVVAVVGDGHVQGLSSILANHQLKVIRLKALRSGDYRKDIGKAMKGNAEVNFQFDVAYGAQQSS